jgi:alpha-1,3-mannosyl-glycoprotein beta-1,2-N-acetylglucosaminyltransferase
MYSADELYRSDFFPGLGWMLTKSIWDELSPKWPKAYPFSIVYIVLKSGFYSVS